MNSESWIFLAAFLLILALMVGMRLRNSKFEVKTTDIILALFPLVIYLLQSGKIKELSFGDLTIKTAFVEASGSKIESQVAPLTGLPSRKISMDPKRGVGEIPRLIAKKTEGLKFYLNYPGYYGPAIKEYITELTRHPFLKYIILEKEDGTFFGLADARAFNALIANRNADINSNKFADWLIQGNEDELRTLPGFISQNQAVYSTMDKGQVLQRMEDMNVDVLPSLSPDKKFVGVVDRSRLTASLIIDVTHRLKKDKT